MLDEHLSFQIPVTKLRLLTPFKSQHTNATKWSSKHQMVKRCVFIQRFSLQPNYPEVIKFIPDNEERKRIENI